MSQDVCRDTLSQNPGAKLPGLVGAMPPGFPAGSLQQLKDSDTLLVPCFPFGQPHTGQLRLSRMAPPTREERSTGKAQQAPAFGRAGRSESQGSSERVVIVLIICSSLRHPLEHADPHPTTPGLSDIRDFFKTVPDQCFAEFAHFETSC